MNPMGASPAEKRSPTDLVNIQGLLPLGSNMMHLNEQEIGHRGQEICVDE